MMAVTLITFSQIHKKEAATRAGMSQRQATEYVYRAFAREQGIDIAPHPGPTRSKPPTP
jgi:hypothetical protein